MDDNTGIAENKVFILYFIRKIEMPIGNIQLIKIILENRFMNYFYLQQYLSELIQEGLLAEKSQDNQQYYELSDKGLEILEMFKYMLPAGLKKRVDKSISLFRKNIRMETFISADYTLDNNDGYTAHCIIKEDEFTLLEVKITTGSREDARDICKNWTSSPQELYSEILNTLIKERNCH
jgi:predicted transcriptional regulator